MLLWFLKIIITTENIGKIISAALRKGAKIYVGKTHADCLKQESMGTLRNAEQGFVTETYEFVDRKQALKIAEHYNQIKRKLPIFRELSV